MKDWTELKVFLRANGDDLDGGGAFAEPPDELGGYLAQAEPGFSRCLANFIRRAGLDEVTVYTLAGIDRRLFSKIRSCSDYQPRKATVLAFAVVLKLSMADTKTLLESAGFALSGSTRFDLIVRYFLERQEYSLFSINEALYAFHQPTLP